MSKPSITSKSPRICFFMVINSYLKEMTNSNYKKTIKMFFCFVYFTVWFVPHAKSLISGLGKISTLFFVFSTKVIIGLGSLTVAKLIAPALSIYSPLVLCPNCPYSGKPNEYKVPLQSSKMLNSAPQPTFTIGGPLYLT